ncbi:hypothetical protein Lal_00030485 [Lupinus albus]|uniref:Uncharacterized protein n=1 Tax=Lupinus albus TaxID=3870 RepID=A0A6A4NPU3_LUPAL|nr:hypothetical protein Lalb_Chr17g0342231 [Lupinus albus]KAF1863453.1 hypothetical protein Lal_00030485 [Lupinus albus]
MGLKVERWCQITWIIVCLFLSSLVEASDTYDHDSLDTFLCKHANRAIGKPRTGAFYNISLPGNFTGIDISVVRLRTVSFWLRGVNYSFFNIPKRVVPQPNRKRMAILYENLGNWSSHYYNVPNYTMLAPVFGIIPYTSSETTLIDCEKMNLIIQGKPIRIQFPHIRPHAKNVTPICVKFGADGSVKFRNMIKPYVCEAKSEGHYTIVVPTTKSHTQNLSKGFKFNIWWVLGFVICFVGLFVLVLVLIIVVKVVKRRKIRKMEKNSEKGEAFDTFWIGETKVPFASIRRTQPVLENDDVPS